jgi:hypothetical protein
MNEIKNVHWEKIIWSLLGCVSLFFFFRGIHLILTGGGWIATTDQSFHWVLLFLEIIIAAFTAFLCFFLWYQLSFIFKGSISRRLLSIKTVMILIIIIFFIHFIRVGFWIKNSFL